MIQEKKKKKKQSYNPEIHNMQIEIKKVLLYKSGVCRGMYYLGLLTWCFTIMKRN